MIRCTVKFQTEEMIWKFQNLLMIWFFNLHVLEINLIIWLCLFSQSSLMILFDFFMLLYSQSVEWELFMIQVCYNHISFNTYHDDISLTCSCHQRVWLWFLQLSHHFGLLMYRIKIKKLWENWRRKRVRTLMKSECKQRLKDNTKWI